eukprot:6476590-Prymnesium_polylepis.1
MRQESASCKGAEANENKLFVKRTAFATWSARGPSAPSAPSRSASNPSKPLPGNSRKHSVQQGFRIQDVNCAIRQDTKARQTCKVKSSQVIRCTRTSAPTLRTPRRLGPSAFKLHPAAPAAHAARSAFPPPLYVWFYTCASGAATIQLTIRPHDILEKSNRVPTRPSQDRPARVGAG